MSHYLEDIAELARSIWPGLVSTSLREGDVVRSSFEEVGSWLNH